MAEQKKSEATEAKAIREKRDDYDLEAPVPQNVPRTVGVSGISAKDEGKKDAKGIDVVLDGDVATVSIGNESVRLGRDEILEASRVFSNLAAGL